MSLHKTTLAVSQLTTQRLLTARKGTQRTTLRGAGPGRGELHARWKTRSAPGSRPGGRRQRLRLRVAASSSSARLRTPPEPLTRERHCFLSTLQRRPHSTATGRKRRPCSAGPRLQGCPHRRAAEPEYRLHKSGPRLQRHPCCERCLGSPRRTLSSCSSVQGRVAETWSLQSSERMFASSTLPDRRHRRPNKSQ